MELWTGAHDASPTMILSSKLTLIGVRLPGRDRSGCCGVPVMLFIRSMFHLVPSSHRLKEEALATPSRVTKPDSFAINALKLVLALSAFPDSFV